MAINYASWPLDKLKKEKDKIWGKEDVSDQQIREALSKFNKEQLLKEVKSLEPLPISARQKHDQYFPPLRPTSSTEMNPGNPLSRNSSLEDLRKEEKEVKKLQENQLINRDTEPTSGSESYKAPWNFTKKRRGKGNTYWKDPKKISGKLISASQLTPDEDPPLMLQPYRQVQQQVNNCKRDLDNRFPIDKQVSPELRTVINGIDTLRINMEEHLIKFKVTPELKIFETRFQDYRK